MRVLLLLLLAGCATVDEDTEYRDAENANKWAECQRIYRDLGAPTVSHHHHQRGRSHKSWEIREDLVLNQCSTLVRDY
jgi:hypothetical protein